MIKPYYQDEHATIYQGNALDIIPQLSNIGAVVTDPPYSSGGQFRGDRIIKTSTKYVQTESQENKPRPEFAGDNRDQRAFLLWCSMWMQKALEVSVQGAPLISFTDWRQLPTMSDAAQVGGWVWRNIGTWWKPGCRMIKGRFSSSAEYFIYCTNGAAINGPSSPQNVFSCAPVRVDNKSHIAQKPLGVMKWALSIVNDDAVVLDPFMGSGTTIRAAKDSGLKVIGIELDEYYCEKAAERLQQKTLFP